MKFNDAMMLDKLATRIHLDNRVAGWWDGEPTTETYATKIALIHSEVSEMLEGLRKGTDDDHLKGELMEHVEAADVLIRLLDYCGARGIEIGLLTMLKLEYNATRADHKRENREKEGGKKI